MTERLIEREILHWHMCCGLGGGARGFNRGQARVGNMVAKFRCIGGIDNDAAGLRDFRRLSGVAGTNIDLFDFDQYVAFHGKLPPPGWRPATIHDIQASAGGERPNIVFASMPCKGFSGLLAEKQSKTDKYQALNGLTLRGIFLMLEAWKDDPPELVILENVPRIATRGRYLVDQMVGLLRGYGYAVAETVHNCGKLGGLSQSRERFLMVARYMPKVPNFLYEPPQRPLRGVGEVLDRMPLPGDIERGGPMHRVPALAWKTWVRLAFVEAGKDWRSLNSLRVEDGYLRDFAIAPESEWQAGVLGVNRWADHTGVVPGRSSPTNGAHSVADPREEMWGGGQAGVSSWDQPAPTVTSARSPLQNRGAVADPRVDGHEKSVQLGVRPWEKPAGVVTGKMFAGGGPNSVADPRLEEKPRYSNVYRIVPWSDQAPAVTSAHGALAAVSDPRGDENRHVNGKYRITPYDGAANAVIAASSTGNGACAVADPRGEALRNGALGVLPFEDPAGVVLGESLPSNGAFAVADPREAGRHHGVLGVKAWDEESGVVQSASRPSNGTFAVADPRPQGGAADQHGKHRVTEYDEASRAVIAGRDNGAAAVADPRIPDGSYNVTKYQVTPYSASSRAVIGASTAGDGAYAVADPRPTRGPNAHTNKHKVVAYGDEAPVVTGSDRVGSGALSVADPRPHGLAKNGRGKDPINGVMYVDHYGVLDWDETSKAVSGSAQIDNGRWAVADRRVDLLPGLAEQLVCIIIARDGTWHRPFTTLELAALQSLYDPEDALELDGKSDSAWRERIGNAVPSAAAQAMADVFGDCLLRAWAGESFSLSSESIWVRQMQVALSVDLSGQVPA